jgi:GAF domain-containing protein
MWDRVKRFLAAPVFADEEKSRIATLLNIIIFAVMLVSLLRITGSLISRSENLGAALLINGVLIFTMEGLRFLMRIGRVKLSSYLAIGLVWGIVAITSIRFGGIRGPLYGSLGAVILAAGLLLGGGAAAGYAAASVALGVALFVLERQGIVSPDSSILEIVPMFVNVTPRFAFVAVLVYLYHRGFNKALVNARQSTADLRVQGERLQNLVDERSRELARRTGYLGAATAVAQAAQAIEGDLSQLFPRVVNVISTQFGFYHTGLFLLDAGKEWMVLQAASSEGGQRMVAREHRLQVGGQSIVGYVAAQGERRIALDVGQDAVYFDNPDLPETRSEMAVPLRVRGEVLGVLDVQSTEAQAFTDEDITTLQALADQVSMAVSNARLLRQIEESLAAERRTMGEVTRQAWLNFLQAHQDLGFYDNGREIVPAGEIWRTEMDRVLNEGVRVIDDDGSNLAIPLRVRDQVIGVIGGFKDEGTTWSDEEITLLETVAVQLGVALEGAQLYQDTQRRAVQERLVGEVTSRIRETLDMETMLRTATGEIRQALNLGDLVIRLVPPKSDDQGK